ncbi:antitoxin VbhA family protein [Paracidovorax citrulli]
MNSRHPTPEEIRSARKRCGLTQTQAGALLHTSCRTWQQWEADPGTKDHRAMHPAFWELFRLKVASALPFLEGNDMTIFSKAQRRIAHDQALASTRIEGHKPTPQFLADLDAVVNGSMTLDQARAASLARARAKDQEVSHSVSVADAA